MLDFKKAVFVERFERMGKDEVGISFTFSEEDTQNIISGEYKHFYSQNMQYYWDRFGEEYKTAPPYVGLTLKYRKGDFDKQHLTLEFGVVVNGSPRDLIVCLLAPYEDYSATDTIALLKIALAASE